MRPQLEVVKNLLKHVPGLASQQDVLLTGLRAVPIPDWAAFRLWLHAFERLHEAVPWWERVLDDEWATRTWRNQAIDELVAVPILMLMLMAGTSSE